MITNPLFRRNYFIFTFILLFFLFLSVATSFFLMSYDREKYSISRVHFFSNIINDSNQDVLSAVRQLKMNADENFFLDFDLIDKTGKSYLSPGMSIGRGLSDEELNQIEKEKILSISTNNLFSSEIKISQTKESDKFFYVSMNEQKFHASKPFLVPLVSMIMSILLSVGFSLLLFFYSYRRKAHEAIKILREIKSGNLKARMSIDKLDELAPIVKSFNQMADEIERLIDSLLKSDQARRQLLQDLAHDLRTPLASIKVFIETLADSFESFDKAKRIEIFNICIGEINYFSKLVEDLLFLAQITEPKYVLGNEIVNFQEELEEVILVFKNQYPQLHFDLKIEKYENYNELEISDSSSYNLKGSKQLIERLLRNAFSNTCSFAKSRISIFMKIINKDEIEIVIQDDGPGFSEKSLKEFGHKKATREIITQNNEKRFSVGIGSVIMREIVQIHSGNFKIENQVIDKKISGASLTLSLKKL